MYETPAITITLDKDRTVALHYKRVLPPPPPPEVTLRIKAIAAVLDEAGRVVESAEVAGVPVLLVGSPTIPGKADPAGIQHTTPVELTFPKGYKVTIRYPAEITYAGEKYTFLMRTVAE